MPVTWTRAQARASKGTQGSTHYLRLQGRAPNPDLPPVVVLHGWSASNTWQTVLGGYLTGLGTPFGNRHLDVLLDTGRTLYCPFTGSNWGTNTTSPGGLGGTGLVGIDDAITAAENDGHTLPPDIVATSGGGCSALVWGWTNPTAWRRMYLITPAFDLSYAYDQDATTTGWGLGSISSSMRGIYSSADKTEWLVDSADVDPYRNTSDVATIAAGRIAMFAATDDEVIPWANLEPWAETLGIPVRTGTGGHLLFSASAGWDDLAPYRWLTARVA